MGFVVTFFPNSQKLFVVIQILVKRLFQGGKGEERSYDTDGADRERAALESHMPAEQLEQEGDGDHHAAHEVGDRRGDRRTEVRAELLRGNGHEDGPVAAGKPEDEADSVEEAGTPASLQEVEGDPRDRHEHVEQHNLFSALHELAQKAARKISEDQAKVTEHDRISG